MSCTQVARTPVTPACCGRCFCQDCLPAQDCVQTKSCPHCNKVVGQAFIQIFYQDTILKLRVACGNRSKGCEWEGLLGDLENHHDQIEGGCAHVEVPCPRGCGQAVERGKVDAHLREACAERRYTCQYCSKEGTYQSIVYQHWPCCAYKPVRCPNLCGVTCEQSLLEEHAKTCSLSVVPCPYAWAGCPAQFPRKDDGDHLGANTQHHLDLVMAACQQLREEQARDREQQERRLRETLRGFEERLRALEGEKENIQRLHKQRIQEYEEKFTMMKQRFDTVMRAKDHSLRDHTQRQVESAVAREIEAFRLTAGLLPYCFTLPRFQDLKGKNEIWYSPHMLTHPQGYTFLVSVRPNGFQQSKDRSVGAWLRSVRGQYDQRLKWPVKVTITLQLLNQHADSDHVSKTAVFELRRVKPLENHIYINAFSYDLVSHSDLDWSPERKTQYLRDNCLKFRVSEITVH